VGKPLKGLRANGITISERNIKLVSGKSKKLFAFPLPALAENQKINWTSSDDKIVTVDNTGMVFAITSGNGKAVITAKTSDGGFTTSCEVSVAGL
jgi:uncharacterized protein YjdB